MDPRGLRQPKRARSKLFPSRRTMPWATPAWDSSKCSPTEQIKPSASLSGPWRWIEILPTFMRSSGWPSIVSAAVRKPKLTSTRHSAFLLGARSATDGWSWSASQRCSSKPTPKRLPGSAVALRPTGIFRWPISISRLPWRGSARSTKRGTPRKQDLRLIPRAQFVASAPSPLGTILYCSRGVSASARECGWPGCRNRPKRQTDLLECPPNVRFRSEAEIPAQGRDFRTGYKVVEPSPASIRLGPPVAIPLDVAGQILLVIRPLLVFGQPDFLHRGIGAFRRRHFLHFRRQFLQESQVILCVLLGSQAAACIGMTGDHAVPVQRDHLLDRVFVFDRRDVVRHVAELHTFDRNEIEYKNRLCLRQPHHERTVGMVATDVNKFERRAAERDGFLLVDDLVRHHN